MQGKWYVYLFSTIDNLAMIAMLCVLIIAVCAPGHLPRL